MELLNSIYEYQVLYRPGVTLSQHDRKVLRKELYSLGALCLHPVPDYQVFSKAEACLNNKLIVTAYTGTGSARELVAFTSAVILDVEHDDEQSTVIHGGLTLVAPNHRQKGMTISLFTQLFVEIVERYEGCIWLSNLSALPNLLVLFHTFVQDVYPSPTIASPNSKHLAIARTISDRFRSEMLIAPAATLDEDTFVVRGSNADVQAECFQESKTRPHQHVPRKDVHRFYVELLRGGNADEVLQIGHLDKSRLVAKASDVLGSQTVLAEPTQPACHSPSL